MFKFFKKTELVINLASIIVGVATVAVNNMVIKSEIKKQIHEEKNL